MSKSTEATAYAPVSLSSKTKLRIAKLRAERILEYRWSPIIPIFVVLVCARGLRVWSLGVYWDDWRILVRGVQEGSAGIFAYMAGERILMGASHALLFALFGPNTLAWHVTNVALEFFIALLIYKLLKRLLPGSSLLPVFATCLFIAYPLSVIRMHMINVYINVAILLAGLSLYLTSYPLGRPADFSSKKTRVLATVLAAFFIPFYLLSYEMPAGLEVVRLYILWMIGSRTLAATASWRERAILTVKAYLPYMAGLAVFVAVRIFLYTEIAKSLNAPLRYAFGPESLALPVLNTSAWHPGPFKFIHLFFHTLIAPWLNAVTVLANNPYQSLNMRYSGWTWTFAWFLAIATASFILWYGRNAGRQRESQRGLSDSVDNPGEWAAARSVRLLFFSVVALAAALGPIWIHPLHNLLYFNNDSRHGYMATAVAAVVWLAVAGYLTRIVFGPATRRAAFTLVAAVVIGLGVGYNAMLTDDWIEEWRRTQATWRQVLVLVPNIKEGSVIILSRPDEFKAHSEPLRHRDVYEPAQLFYGITYGKILGSPATRLNPFGRPHSVVPWLGTGEWQRKMSAGPLDPEGVMVDRDRILILDESEGCVKVLDGKRSVQDVSSPLLNAIGHFSNLDVIQPPSEKNISMRRRLLGEPARLTWCDYYVRASRLQHEKEWRKSAALYRQMHLTEERRRHFVPINPVEWLPFIAALNHMERYDLAEEMIVDVRAGSTHTRRAAQEALGRVREDFLREGRSVEPIDHQIKLLSLD
jgi:hypothetical protein